MNRLFSKFSFHLKVKSEHRPMYIGFSVGLLVFIAFATFSIMQFHALSIRIDTLTMSLATTSERLASSTQQLEQALSETHTTLTSALSAEQQHVGTIQQQLGNFQNQVGNLSGTVTTLQKLAQTDPQLLKKYSKVYFLNENYIPARLSEIPLTYQYTERKQMLFETDALPFLENMILAASSSGITLYVDSAYRSFDEQKALKGIYTMEYGAGTANSFSADQGYSEHQLGTATDLITPGLGGELTDAFDTTKAYTWLTQNAYKFGFILSYPKNNGYYVYEPWHWRFVGIRLATYLHDNNTNFYDLDQRFIDSFLADIFDK